MFPGVDPKQMQGMMKKMGISQEDIPAERVIIEKIDGGKIIIGRPTVTKIKMQGEETFQIGGQISEESSDKISERDIQTIVERTGCSEEEAREVLERTGDLAEAIMELEG
jgi:nascent polypeptide-associated complex subunit alpha